MDPPPYQGGPGIAPAGTAQYGGAQFVPQQGYPGYAPQPGSNGAGYAPQPGSNGAGYAPQPGSAYPGSNGAGYAPQPGSAYPGADGAGYAPPTVIIQPVEFGRFPVAMVCPHCQQVSVLSTRGTVACVLMLCSLH